MSERLHRIVGGERIDLTDEEEAAQRAEWSENEAEAARLAQATALAEKRAAALRALEAQMLDEALADLNAPQEVKDYAAALKG